MCVKHEIHDPAAREPAGMVTLHARSSAVWDVVQRTRRAVVGEAHVDGVRLAEHVVRRPHDLLIHTYMAAFDLDQLGGQAERTDCALMLTDSGGLLREHSMRRESC